MQYVRTESSKIQDTIGGYTGETRDIRFPTSPLCETDSEEWVRQHFVHWLVEQKGYPKGLLGNEIELRVADKKLRCDSVLYDQQTRPRMIIEYKAPTIPLSQKVFDQISAYNLLLHVDYLVISNGMEHYCCRMNYENNSYDFLQDIPDYKTI